MKEDEIIYLFVHWCRKEKISPIAFYREIFPQQEMPSLLLEISQKEEDSTFDVSDEFILQVMMHHEQHEIAEKIYMFLKSE